MNTQSSIASRTESLTDATDAMPIHGITIAAPRTSRQSGVFTTDALRFLSALHREFGGRIAELATSDLRGNTTLIPVERDISLEGNETSWNALLQRYLMEPPTAFTTPRRLMRSEDRVIANGEPLSAGLVDFALHIHSSARRLISEGRAPFISLLGIDGEQEIEIWQEMFTRAEELVGLPAGAIRAITFSDSEDDSRGAVLLQNSSR